MQDIMRKEKRISPLWSYSVRWNSAYFGDASVIFPLNSDLSQKMLLSAFLEFIKQRKMYDVTCSLLTKQ